MVSRATRLLFAAVCLLGSAVAAPGQDLSLGPAWSANDLLSDALAQRALRDLGEQATPDAALLQRAGILLDEALRHSPDDVELLRWRAELAGLAGDLDAQQRALRLCLQRTPDDDALQLRLLLTSLNDMQTLDERIAGAARWLDDARAQGLSASLRSRLASSAAAWALELGDGVTAGRRLGEALSLDTTNRPATLLALDLSGQRTLSAGQRASLWQSAVEAAPHDASLRASLADALAALGLPDLAQAQAQAALTLGLTLSDEDRAAWLTRLGEPVTPVPAPVSADAAAIAAVRRVIERWPAAIRSPNPRQQPWALLQVEVQLASSRYLDPILATISLRNGSGAALAIGAREAIPSRLMIYVTPRVEGVAQPTLPPVVVDLGRRLALKSAESVTLTVPLQRSALGAWLADRPWQTVSLSMVAVLDPVLLDGGAVGVSDRGVVTAVRRVDRRALLPTTANVAAWQGEAMDESAPLPARMIALARLWRLAIAPVTGQEGVTGWLTGQVATLPEPLVGWLALQEMETAGPRPLIEAMEARIKAGRDVTLRLAAASNPWLSGPLPAATTDQPADAADRYRASLAGPGPSPSAE